MNSAIGKQENFKLKTNLKIIKQVPWRNKV